MGICSFLNAIIDYSLLYDSIHYFYSFIIKNIRIGKVSWNLTNTSNFPPASCSLYFLIFGKSNISIWKIIITINHGIEVLNIVYSMPYFQSKLIMELYQSDGCFKMFLLTYNSTTNSLFYIKASWRSYAVEDY